MNKKGFTLVELLAVIVVLAIIMVIAVPTILGNLNIAKKKSFQLEAQRILDNAMAFYNSETLMGTPNLGTFTHADSTTKEACYNFSDFNMTPSGYEGFVIVNHSTSGDTTEYKIYLTNNTYSYVGATYSNVYADKDIMNDDASIAAVKAAKCVH